MSRKGDVTDAYFADRNTERKNSRTEAQHGKKSNE